MSMPYLVWGPYFPKAPIALPSLQHLCMGGRAVCFCCLDASKLVQKLLLHVMGGRGVYCKQLIQCSEMLTTDTREKMYVSGIT